MFYDNLTLSIHVSALFRSQRFFIDVLQQMAIVNAFVNSGTDSYDVVSYEFVCILFSRVVKINR